MPTYYWATVGLPDLITYYGGYKDARIVSFGRVIRTLSDLSGQYQSADFIAEVGDTDRAVRTIIAAATNLVGTRVTVRS